MRSSSRLKTYIRQLTIGTFIAVMFMAWAGASGVSLTGSRTLAAAQGTPTPTPSPTATPTPSPSPTPDFEHCQISLSAPAYSVSETAGELMITVNRSCDRARESKVDFFTQNGSAVAGNDFVFAAGRVDFAAGETSKTITIRINDDVFSEGNETFRLILFDAGGSASLVNPGSAVITIFDNDIGSPTPTPTPSPTPGVSPSPTPSPSPSPTPGFEHCQISLSATNYTVNEGSGQVTITVNRACDRVRESKVDFFTRNVTASDRSDFSFAAGRLFFANGETSKNINVLITDDALVEGNETFNLFLTDAGGSAMLVNPSAAVITIIDNDTSASAPNPLERTDFFVQQHYADFLGRQGDPGGLAAWQDIINNCARGTDCDRVHVSSAFFLSPEFQERGYFVYRFYEVAFGRKPDYAEFMPDIARVSGFFTEPEKEAQKAAFIDDLMSRNEFLAKYNALTDAGYVDELLRVSGLPAHASRNAWINDLQEGRKTRAQILREIVESGEVYRRFLNRAFVVMQYFGYLRRDPDALYVNWIRVLDDTGDSRVMINGFVNSLEYKFRFGR